MTGQGQYGTGKSRDGLTTHRCRRCKRRFEGTQRRGRPFKTCPECRAKEEEAQS